MKLNKFLLSAIAAASLTACSDSPDVVKNDKGHWNADGTGYVSLSISMPDNVGSKGSRETINNGNNDEFDHGTKNEYAVYNAMLIIFTSTDATNNDEDTYNFNTAYNMPLSFTSDTQTSQISSKLTAHIDGINAARAKALVILNKPDDAVMKLNDDKTINFGTEKFGTEKTFKDFKDQAIKIATILESAKGFTMTNAPLTNLHSTTESLVKPTSPTTPTTTTLAEIDLNKVRNTPEASLKEPAANIYVERSVAKVTVEDADNNAHQLGDNTNIHYKIEGYDLNNTNSTSYLTRHADATTTTWSGLKSGSFTETNKKDTQYRFVGNKEVGDGTGLYRTYWAEDPNYSGNTGLTTITKTTADFSNGIGVAKYCMENTFNVESQKQANTTLAVLKVRFWKGTEPTDGNYPTLFMFNNDIETLLTDETGTSDFTNKVVTEVNKIPAVASYHGGVKSVEYTDVTNGKKKINKVTYNDNTKSDEVGSNDANILNIIVNHIGDVSVYENGIAYYNVLIKHFGEDLTPWHSWENGTNAKIPTVGDIYPDNSDANYLGRYGVLRNNWYNLKVNKVSKIGTPDIDTPLNSPDDNLESYISVSINILSWAKRSQDVDLQ